jgi:hypothetical protein
MQAKTNPNQMVLSGVEMAWCKCGCGQSFMRAARGRRREYINKTHKKREARRLAKSRQTDTRVSLAPKGYLYLNARDNREISALWGAMTPSQKVVITALCETGLEPQTLIDTTVDLFHDVLK